MPPPPATAEAGTIRTIATSRIMPGAWCWWRRLLTGLLLFQLQLMMPDVVVVLVQGQRVHSLPQELRPTPSSFDLHLSVFAEIPHYPSPLRLNTIVTSPDGRMFVTAEEGYVYELPSARTVAAGAPAGVALLMWDLNEAWPKFAGGRSLYRDGGWHSGLRGMALSADFATSGIFYTSAMEYRPSTMDDDDDAQHNHHYISDVRDPVVADSVVSEWTVAPLPDDDNANSGVFFQPILQYRELFRVGTPVLDHPVKDLALSPHDGYLYILHGDASVQSATAGGGMRNDALGKILRIDPRRRAAPAVPPSSNHNGTTTLSYSIPADNPFVHDDNMISEAYSIGHRNPHTLCFGRDGTLLVGEVGRDNVDEVNLIENGANYGWPDREGMYVHRASGGIGVGIAPLPVDDAVHNYTYPVSQFGHFGKDGAGFVGQAVATGCAVENGSPADGLFFAVEFATVGDVYVLDAARLKTAVTRGDPARLSPVVPGIAKLWLDHDNDPITPPLRMGSFIDVINYGPEAWYQLKRTDARFGRGPRGELYLSSKRNNKVYLLTTTLPGGPGGYKASSYDDDLFPNLSINIMDFLWQLIKLIMSLFRPASGDMEQLDQGPMQ